MDVHVASFAGAGRFITAELMGQNTRCQGQVACMEIDMVWQKASVEKERELLVLGGCRGYSFRWLAIGIPMVMFMGHQLSAK